MGPVLTDQQLSWHLSGTSATFTLLYSQMRAVSTDNVWTSVMMLMCSCVKIHIYLHETGLGADGQ